MSVLLIYGQDQYKPDFQVFLSHQPSLLHQRPTLEVVHPVNEAFPVLQCFHKGKKLQSIVVVHLGENMNALIAWEKVHKKIA